MKLFCNKKSPAYKRLQRIKAVNDIIERTTGFRGGRAFIVDTSGLKDSLPIIRVTERSDRPRLIYADRIANLCQAHKRKFEIVMRKRKLTYIIY